MKCKWKTERRCFCGKTFTPHHHSQRFCCKAHARIWNSARQSIFGRDLIRSDPAAAIRWYDYLTQETEP